MFEYHGGKMKMNMDLDLTSHNIINSYQITRLTDFMNYFLLFKNFMKNKTYIDIFTYRFYDLKEPSNFILDGPAISGINPNMSIISSGSSHITVSGFDPIRGLQFNPSTNRPWIYGQPKFTIYNNDKSNIKRPFKIIFC